MKNHRPLYLGIGIFLSLLFVKAIYPYVEGGFFEHDLLWFIPTIYRSLEGLSGINIMRFLLDPAPIMYGIPSLKIYAFFVFTFFGPIAKYFIATAILFHLGSSGLLFSLSRKMGFDLRTSFFSAITYLTLFAHYQAYMWPMAAQHLFAVFFIMLVLSLYLETDRRILTGGAHRFYYFATIISNFLASFCRTSVVIIPLAVIVHIIFCSRDAATRVKRFNTWLPLFVIYLFYPLITLTYVGDNRINIYLANANHHIVYLMLFAAGVAGLFLFGWVLKIAEKIEITKRLRRTVLIGVIVCIYVILCVKDIKNLFLPYNMFIPFAGILASFLEPIRNALSNDSARPLGYICLQLSVSYLIVSLFLIAAFFRKIRLENRAAIILIPWYLAGLCYLNLRNPIVSRYFVYISPIFCIIFYAGITDLISSLCDLVRLRNAIKELILALILIALCVPNVLAISLDIMRGRLANNFLNYDYIRIAYLIREDMKASDIKADMRPQDIYVDGLPALLLKAWSFAPVDPYRCDNFTFAMADIFKNRRMTDMHINDATSKRNGSLSYRVTSSGNVENTSGADIDIFRKLHEEARAKLNVKKYQEAERLLGYALRRRPFLLNYVLSGLQLEDLRWIINETDMHDWVQKISFLYEVGQEDKERIRYVSSIIEDELRGYIECLFFASYCAWRSGDMEKSAKLFSQIRFLDSDYERLCAYLSAVPAIKSNDDAMSFLKRQQKASLYADVEYKNTYMLERFLLKLLFGTSIARENGTIMLKMEKHKYKEGSIGGQ